jgi:hypothetical protein
MIFYFGFTEAKNNFTLIQTGHPVILETFNLNNSYNNVLAFSFGRTVKANHPNYKQQPALITLCELKIRQV